MNTKTRQLIGAFATLESFGEVTLTMHIPSHPSERDENNYYANRDIDAYYDRLQKISDLICSMQSFNNKDNKVISDSFAIFYADLPTRTFVNGGEQIGHLFDKITFNRDDTIILTATVCGNDVAKEYNIDESRLRDIVNRYGKAWNADEYRVIREPHPIIKNWYDLTIRFWWD